MTTITVFFRRRNRNPQQLNIYINDSHLEIEGKKSNKKFTLTVSRDLEHQQTALILPHFFLG